MKADFIIEIAKNDEILKTLKNINELEKGFENGNVSKEEMGYWIMEENRLVRKVLEEISKIKK